MADQMETHGLRAFRPAVTPEEFRVRFVWSARLTRDPASLWLRTLVMETYAEVQAEANLAVGAEVVEISPSSG